MRKIIAPCSSYVCFCQINNSYIITDSSGNIIGLKKNRKIIEGRIYNDAIEGNRETKFGQA